MTIFGQQHGTSSLSTKLALATRHAGPHHLEQAQHIRGLLTEEAQTLKLIEEELKGHPIQDIHKRVSLDRVSVAIDYLQKGLDELGMAIRE